MMKMRLRTAIFLSAGWWLGQLVWQGALGGVADYGGAFAATIAFFVAAFVMKEQPQ